MIRAWCLTRSNGRILGLGPNSLPQVYRTRELARDASKTLQSLGIKTTVRSTDELTTHAWAVVRDEQIVGNGVTSVPMVFKTREQARNSVSFAEDIGYKDVTVVRIGNVSDL